MLAHGPIGLFGKIPSHGDFVRVNVADPAVGPLVRWLEEGNEARHRAGATLSPEPLGFLFRAPESDGALVGVLGPGSDKVGRSFPIAVFVPVRGKELTSHFPLVPALYRAFLDSARAFLGEVAALTAAQVADRLRTLPLPGAGEIAAAEGWARDAASREHWREMQARLFGDGSAGQQYYACRTFQTACRPVRGRDPGKVNVALDCPWAQDVDLYAWLELARRSLAWAAPPPFFWRGGAAPALIISLGAPPASLLGYLATPSRESSKIWPLRTSQAPAIAAARQGLPAAQIALIDGADVTIEQLVSSLSR